MLALILIVRRLRDSLSSGHSVSEARHVAGLPSLEQGKYVAVEVQLHEEPGEVHLIIRDLGKGFDIEAARQGRGLGLTSMQERVRLVSGTIDIQSKPMRGTTIYVRVPLGAKHSSQQAPVSLSQ